MQFLAHLKRGSAVDRMWRGAHRLGGKIAGVAFKLNGGDFATGIYSAGELAAAEVTALRNHDSVQLESIGAHGGAPAMAIVDQVPPRVDQVPPRVDQVTRQLDELTPAPTRRGRKARSEQAEQPASDDSDLEI